MIIMIPAAYTDLCATSNFSIRLGNPQDPFTLILFFLMAIQNTNNKLF